MQDAESLLTDLADRGIHLVLDNTDLIVQPASKLTDRDRFLIREYKSKLLVTLREAEISRSPGMLDTALIESHGAVELSYQT